jgi:NAD-dependent DNA ligase
LTTLIQEHDHLYYTQGLSPTVLDEKYDAIFNKKRSCVTQIESLSFLKPESCFTLKAGKLFQLENFPMQSLDNEMLSIQVLKWMNTVRKILFKAREEEYNHF